MTVQQLKSFRVFWVCENFYLNLSRIRRCELEDQAIVTYSFWAAMGNFNIKLQSN